MKQFRVNRYRDLSRLSVSCLMIPSLGVSVDFLLAEDISMHILILLRSKKDLHDFLIKNQPLFIIQQKIEPTSVHILQRIFSNLWQIIIEVIQKVLFLNLDQYLMVKNLSRDLVFSGDEIPRLFKQISRVL